MSLTENNERKEIIDKLKNRIIVLTEEIKRKNGKIEEMNSQINDFTAAIISGTTSSKNSNAQESSEDQNIGCRESAPAGFPGCRIFRHTQWSAGTQAAASQTAWDDSPLISFFRQNPLSYYINMPFRFFQLPRKTLSGGGLPFCRHAAANEKTKTADKKGNRIIPQNLQTLPPGINRKERK